MHTKARHETISFEVVEWSEQLRSVTSVWLGAAAVGSNPTLHQRVKSENDFWYISPRVICFLHVVLIKSRPSLAVFLSSLRLSYFFRVAMVVGCSIAVTP